MAKHGCQPTHSLSDSDFPGLANWCYHIQTYKNKKKAGKGGPLSDEKEQELRDIGFVFTSDDGTTPKRTIPWEQRIAQLREFKAQYGHCKPKCGENENGFPGLANWCYLIQSYMNKKRAGEELGMMRLPDEREKELRDIGFVFTADKAT